MSVKEKKVNIHNNTGFVKWFSELSSKDVSIAGGKGASLAEMYNHKFPIPPGFMVTAQAYQYFIEKCHLDDKIQEIVSKIDVEDTSELTKASKQIRDLIRGASMPEELEEEITEAYDILDVGKQEIIKAGSGALQILKNSHEPPFVAVRSSATTEDLADASFAGQQDSFLSVKGNRNLLLKVKDCMSSLFTARAIYYREKKGFGQAKASLAVVVQRMVDSDKSGVIFSKDPVKKAEQILIEAVWGLGEGIVSGRIQPDSYIVDSNLDEFKILELTVANKRIAIIRNSSGENTIVKLTEEKSRQQVLSTYEIKVLSQYAKKLEEHYGKPQDIEFAIEGRDIFIVQSRPITTKISEGEKGEIKGEIFLSGLGASPGVASGIVKIIHSMNDLNKIKKGDILVTKMTNPDMVVAMQKSAAIVTDDGGITSHASIVSREMGIPAVVGTEHATEKLKEGEIVTVDGYKGKVYKGKMETREVEVNPVFPTKTKIKVIVDLPDFAQRAAKSHAKGIGLVRLEGIIAISGKHPLKFVKDKNIEDYISLLVKGLTKIIEPFEEAWIRSSDIRSDEYRNLEGAPKEIEGNPMLGDHGIRFSLKHPDIMKAELIALKRIAETFPHKKVGFMVPQVISVEELRKTKEIAREVNIPKNVKIGIMVETPAAVQIINDLCEEGMDFVSFGTNDLTQYTLAIDRNNTEVQDLYNEMNPAVLNSLAYVIRRCKKYGVETSLCGQAGSREDMARFLVSQGIDSISVNADAAYNVSKLVAELENAAPSIPAPEPPVESVKLPRLKEDVKEEQKESQLETGQEIRVPVIQPLVQSTPPPQLEQPQIASNPPPSNPPIANNSNMPDIFNNKDIEELALSELGDEDYGPGNAEENQKKEIPPLNDAIPVESEHLEEKPKEEEIELVEDKEEKEPGLSDEWKGEKTPQSSAYSSSSSQSANSSAEDLLKDD